MPAEGIGRVTAAAKAPSNGSGAEPSTESSSLLSDSSIVSIDSTQAFHLAVLVHHLTISLKTCAISLGCAEV